MKTLASSRAELFVDRRQIKIHFARKLRSALLDFQIDHHEAAQTQVVEQQVETLDLTLPGHRAKLEQYSAGGGDDFVHVLLEEIKPLVESHYQVDPERQIIYGKSLGGLLVLHLLFVHPEAFQTYIAASPSIWWDNRSVLSDENSFWQRIKT